jgi:hypothetical protein
MNLFEEYINVNVSREFAERLIGLLAGQRDALLKDMESKREEFIKAEANYNECVELMMKLQSFDKDNSSNGTMEKYSKLWKWPQKTLFVLKQLKRSVTANEVIKAIGLYEGEFDIAKKTSIFTTLTNLSEANKIVRTKPGNEYAYCLPEFVEDDEDAKIEELRKLATLGNDINE